MGVRRSNVTPPAARLTDSLRDIGYDSPPPSPTSLDNSIAAGAGRIFDALIEAVGEDSRVFIIDDGAGMSENALSNLSDSEVGVSTFGAIWADMGSA